jgi:hydrogenase expression/formation protein HypE
MSHRIVGKPSPAELSRLLAGNFGKSCPQLLVGPGAGLDAAVLDMEDGRVMAIAEDPIFPAPNLPLEIMGFFTVHIGASDVAVTGIAPQFMTYTLLLPTATPQADAGKLIRSISDTARNLKISIVGGHTGWYDAVTVPTVGGVTVWGMAPADRWVSPGGARDGDVILMTKGPGIEASALLAVLYRDRLAESVCPSDLQTACERVSQISVVEDALTAFAVGGVHAMHDATEGGVIGGLWEMQAACGLPVAVDVDPVPVPADIAAVAKALGFDPWKAISEGTLLAAVSPQAVQAVRQAWSAKGIDSHILGRFDPSLPGGTIRRNGHDTPLPEPGIDPFWDLFFAGLKPA